MISELFDRARRIIFVNIATAAGGMQEANIQGAGSRRGVVARDVLSDVALRKASPMDDLGAQFVNWKRLGRLADNNLTLSASSRRDANRFSAS